MLKYVFAAMVIAGPAASEDLPWCSSPKDRHCVEDLHLKARAAMEEKMAACHGSDEYGFCIRALGWTKPLFQDERFKPLIVTRK